MDENEPRCELVGHHAGSEQCLSEARDERCRGEPGHDGSAASPHDPGSKECREDEELGHAADRAMRVLDDLAEVCGWVGPSMTQRPVRTSKPGPGHPNDATQRALKLREDRSHDRHTAQTPAA